MYFELDKCSTQTFRTNFIKYDAKLHCSYTWYFFKFKAKNKKESKNAEKN